MVQPSFAVNINTSESVRLHSSTSTAYTKFMIWDNFVTQHHKMRAHGRWRMAIMIITRRTTASCTSSNFRFSNELNLWTHAQIHAWLLLLLLLLRHFLARPSSSSSVWYTHRCINILYYFQNNISRTFTSRISPVNYYHFPNEQHSRCRCACKWNAHFVENIYIFYYVNTVV